MEILAAQLSINPVWLKLKFLTLTNKQIKSSKDCYNVELRLVGEKKLINGSQIQGKEGKNKIN